MKVNNIQRMSNGATVDLSTLDETKLKKLHYEEEKYVARKVLKTEAFSEERNCILKQGYNLVNEIMSWYLPSTSVSYGAEEKSTSLVYDFLKVDETKKIIYEAGVGTGFSCERFVKIPNVTVKGCDILIDEKVRQLMKEYSNLQVDEDTLYNSLKKIADHSIDIFYADNVLEHLLPDEFPRILRLLSQKIKKGGILILVIPNKIVGPEDVSKYFVERGKPARGFHFMEMSYQEVLAKFKKVGIFPQYFVWQDKENNIRYIRDSRGTLNFMKLCVEFVVSKLIKKMDSRVKVFNRMGMRYYILSKK